MRTIVIGCDNAAVGLKNTIIEYLKDFPCKVKNVGCDSEGESTYYPYIAERVCQSIIESKYEERGILLCGTGIGMAISANKFPGIRAAVCHDIFSAERSILSNKGNVICLGERVIGEAVAKKMVQCWLALDFKEGSSSPKVEAICELEQKNMNIRGKV